GRLSGTANNGANDGWYLWSGASPGAAGTKLSITPFFNGAALFDGSYQFFGNDLASDGTVLGYTGANASSGQFWVRLPNGSLQQANGLIGRNAVNRRHWVVGTIGATFMGQPTAHAAVWKPDGTVTDLNDELPAGSQYILTDALAINDSGDIVG